MSLPRLREGACVPPGFRFNPTDKELIDYLEAKACPSKFDPSRVIPVVDLNRTEPWDLCDRCNMEIMSKSDLYVFNCKEKKFSVGTRTNRATGAGFWKATGKDKCVYSGCCIGVKKTLVFYKGRAPHSEKTDWIMHEFRLENGDSGLPSNDDGWVVCHIFKKRNVNGDMQESYSTVLQEDQFSTMKAIESNRNVQENFAHDDTLYCEEEVDYTPQVALLTLPQLDSPKTPNMLCHNHDSITRSEYQKEMQEPAFSLEDSSIKGFNCKSLYMRQHSLGGYVDSGLMTDTNVFENLGVDLGSSTVDSLLGQLSSEEWPGEEDLSTCAVELWDFSR